LVADEVNERLERVNEETVGRGAPERLRRLLTEQLTILLIDYPEAARPFARQLDWPEEHSKLLRTLRERHDAALRAVITAGAERGDLANVDSGIALHSIYGAINYAPVWVRGNRATKKRLIDGICDALLEMVMP